MSLISVIVPIYGVEEYLDRCIQSIVNQTWKEFELILVDDGSPDKCPEICENWKKIDERVKVIHKKNGGLSDARNVGMKIAQGDHIVFVDSDDWISPKYLEILMKTMEENQCDIVECDIIWALNESAKLYSEFSGKVTVFQTIDALKQLIEDGCFHQYVWNKLYKREIIKNITFPFGKTNEDEFWTYKIFGKAKRIGKVQIPLYYYFQRNTSIMRERYSLKRLDALEAKIYRQKYIEKQYPELKDIAQFNIITTCIYQGQMSLLYLKGEELIKAKKIITNVVKQVNFSKKVVEQFPLKKMCCFLLAKHSFWNVCKIRNYLKRGID